MHLSSILLYPLATLSLAPIISSLPVAIHPSSGILPKPLLLPRANPIQPRQAVSGDVFQEKGPPPASNSGQSSDQAVNGTSQAIQGTGAKQDTFHSKSHSEWEASMAMKTGGEGDGHKRGLDKFLSRLFRSA